MSKKITPRGAVTNNQFAIMQHCMANRNQYCADKSDKDVKHLIKRELMSGCDYPLAGPDAIAARVTRKGKDLLQQIDKQLV